MTVRDERLAVRLSEENKDLIEQAAAVAGLNLTDFAVSTLVNRAHDVLADQRHFTLDDAAWVEFQELLDAPAVRKPRLAKLLDAESGFE